jgi:hypothetical protein
LIGVDLAELPCPMPHGLVGDDATFGEKVIDVTVAQAKAVGSTKPCAR